MEKETFKALLERYEDGQCPPAERAFVESWFLKAGKSAPALEARPDYDQLDAELRSRLALEPEGEEAPKPARRVWRWFPYAAAAILLAVGWWAVSYQQSDVSLAAEEILPGGNRATLTLADGRVINLDEAQTGIIVGAEDITYQDGTSLAAVIPSAAEESLPNPGDAPVMLTLTTPKAGQYQITLPDGSKVWLNAASTLKYPSRFSGAERVVFLEGEAFFEIRPQVGPVGAQTPKGSPEVNLAPFSVQTANQVVHVLGTEFNLSAYADEEATKTTLVTGRVRVAISPLEGGRGVTEELKPGQQSTVHNDNIQVQAVDVNEYTAWKSGLFILSDTPLSTAIRQLERWYDVEFLGEVHSDKKVSAILPRDINLSDVLKALAENTDMKFTIQGRRVMVQH